MHIGVCTWTCIYIFNLEHESLNPMYIYPLATGKGGKPGAVATLCRRRVSWSLWVPIWSRRPASPSVGSYIFIYIYMVATPCPLPPSFHRCPLFDLHRDI